MTQIGFVHDHIPAHKFFHRTSIREVASVIVMSMMIRAHSTDRAALVGVEPLSSVCYHLSCTLLPGYCYKQSEQAFVQQTSSMISLHAMHCCASMSAAGFVNQSNIPIASFTAFLRIVCQNAVFMALFTFCAGGRCEGV